MATIFLAALHLAQEKVADLNKVADKLGLPPVTLAVGEPREVRIDRDGGRTRLVTMVDVEVVGTAPVLNGWTLLAHVDHRLEAGNIVNVFADDFDAAPWRHAEAGCDHCNLRRDRHDTFVLAHDGEVKQIGSTCLKDFTGHGDPLRAALWFAEAITALDDEDEWGTRGGGGSWAPSLVVFLATTVAVIEAQGWTPKSAGDHATVYTVLDQLSPRPASPIEVTEAHVKTAHEVIEWARAIDLDAAGDYLANLAIALREDIVRERQQGLVASAVAAYNKDLDKAAKAKAEAAVAQPAPEGRVTFTGEIVGIKHVEDNYSPYGGMICKITVAAEGGWKVYLTAPKALRPVERGKVVTLTATLKRSDREDSFAFGSRPSVPKAA